MEGGNVRMRRRLSLTSNSARVTAVEINRGRPQAWLGPILVLALFGSTIAESRVSSTRAQPGLLAVFPGKLATGIAPQAARNNQSQLRLQAVRRTLRLARGTGLVVHPILV